MHCAKNNKTDERISITLLMLMSVTILHFNIGTTVVA